MKKTWSSNDKKTVLFYNDQKLAFLVLRFQRRYKFKKTERRTKTRGTKGVIPIKEILPLND